MASRLKTKNNRKMSLSIIQKAAKVSMSINRRREYSKPIELTSWKNRFFLLFIVLLSISVGIIQVTQAGINISVGIWLCHPLRSAFVSFFIGTLCLLPFYLLCNNVSSINNNIINSRMKYYPLNSINDDFSSHKSFSFSISVNIFNPNTQLQEEVTIITPSLTCHNILSTFRNDFRTIFTLFNGIFGVFFVCSVIYISPLIGFSLFYISLIIGQIITSMFIDNFGLFWSIRKQLTILNIIGSILAIFGAILFQIPSFTFNDASDNKYNKYTVIYVIIAIISGMTSTIQATLNRKLRKIMNGTAYQSTFLSFLNGTFILLIINCVIYYINDDWFQLNNDDHHGFEWWFVFGGILGPFIVTVYIIAPSYIGFVATFICAIFGSLITSFIFDFIGAFGVQSINFSIWEICGVISVFCGSLLVNIRKSNTNRISKEKQLKLINDEYSATMMSQSQSRTMVSNSKSNTLKKPINTFVVKNANNDYLMLTDNDMDASTLEDDTTLNPL